MQASLRWTSGVRSGVRTAAAPAIPWVPSSVSKGLAGWEPHFGEGPASPWASERRGGSLKRNRVPGARLRTGDAERLTGEVEALAVARGASLDLLGRRDLFLRELQRRLEAELPSCRLVPFGSMTSGLWLRDSDLDLSVESPVVAGRVEAKKLLKRVGSVIHRLTGIQAEPRLQAKIPILRWEPEGEDIPCCDISINNSLAVANSQLVGAYVAADARVRPLVVVLKSWARARGINDRSRGTLSSFALTLMLLHLMQRRGLLPSLQALAAQRGEPPREILGADCRFCTDPAGIAEALAQLQAGAEVEGQNLGVLLHAFFRYFGVEYRGGVISIRGDCPEADVERPPLRQSLPLHVREKGAASGRFLFVENPFEPGKDVANVVVGEMARLREELRRAYRHLGQGLPLAQLCQGRSDMRAEHEDIRAEFVT